MSDLQSQSCIASLRLGHTGHACSIQVTEASLMRAASILRLCSVCWVIWACWILADLRALKQFDKLAHAPRLTHMAGVLAAPKARKQPFSVKAPHGKERNDDYYWLRDDDRENKEVLDYLQVSFSVVLLICIILTEPALECMLC